MSDSTAPFPIIDGKYHLGTEPIVRIGVILAEDGDREVRLTPLVAGYHVEGDGVRSELKAGATVIVRRTVDGVALFDMQSLALAASPKRLRIEPPANLAPPKPGSGMLVENITSGRGFHWHKRIDQTLTGVLEFLTGGAALIMINELPLEEYLIGVITGEMSGDCPPEFMKAQATAARSWLLAQPRTPHPGQPFVWCNDDCCQRYQGTGGWSQQAVDAIAACRGQVLITPANQYCDARYSKNTGGISEDASNVWLNDKIDCLEAMIDAPRGSAVEKFFPVTEANLMEYLTGDWLKSTDCYAGPNAIPSAELKKYLGRVDESGSYFRWSVTLTADDLRESLVKRGGIEDLADVIALIPRRRGRSGRINLLTVEYRTKAGAKATRDIVSEYNFRAAMSMKFLYSGAVAFVDEKRAGEVLSEVTLLGAGWGHGAGLCQMGALGRAFAGQPYEEILDAYFAKTRLEVLYN